MKNEPVQQSATEAAPELAASIATTHIENYSSPRSTALRAHVRHIFSIALFIAVFLIAGDICLAIRGGVDIWTFVVALVFATLAAYMIRINPEWERAIVLRFGKYHRTVEPGLFVTIPVIETIVMRVDMRVMVTGFSAEETLTNDLVPVNVDAALFWVVWDAQKACLEVEDYYDSVALAAQTALRDAIGRKSITDVATQRVQLDDELKQSIEEKTSAWGVSIISVEIRDVVIPKDLQNDMSAEARAERRRDARLTLAEAEHDIADMLVDAARVYQQEALSVKLRSMLLLSEGINEAQSTLMVPSSYTEGFVNAAKDLE